MPMDGRHHLIRRQTGLSTFLRDRDFEEQEVLDVTKERKQINSFFPTGSNSANSVPVMRSTPNSNHSSHEHRLVQKSAPVNIPVRSKMCGKKSKASSENGCPRVDGDNSTEENYGEHDDRDTDDFDCNKLPPHELIARRLEKSQISSFSVFEGVGRKLKGRDLSEVRNAVLTKTGFLESL